MTERETDMSTHAFFVISTPSLFVISTEGRNLVLGTGSGRNRLNLRQLRFLGFLATLEMTGEGGFNWQLGSKLTHYQTHYQIFR